MITGLSIANEFSALTNQITVYSSKFVAHVRKELSKLPREAFLSALSARLGWA